MKNISFTSLFAALLLLPVAQAQTDTAVPVIAPAPTVTAPPPTDPAAIPPAKTLAPFPALKENVTLTVQAEPVPGVPVTLTFTGIGPHFETNMPLANPKDDAAPMRFMSFRANVRLVDGAYQVAYELDWRIQEEQTRGTQTTTRYVTHSLSSTVTLKLDQSLTDDKPTQATAAEGKTVTLKISQPAAK